MKKIYLLIMKRKEAQDIFTKMFPNGFNEHGKITFKLPKPNIEYMRVPTIASGEIIYSIANVGNGIFNLYQYED